MSDLLPTDGENPYTYFLFVINSTFYRTPTPGFQARLACLFGLNGLAILLGLIYFVLLLIDAKRKNSVKRFWLFRLVQRPTGRYVATNQNIWSALMAIISSSIILGHINDGYVVYLEHAPQTYTAAWRSLSFLPLFIHGWMISWAIFQSFLLTPDQHDRQLFSARVANSIFIGGGLTLFVGMLSTALISTISGDILWTKAAIVVGKLEAYESTYTGGGLTLAAIEELAPYLAPLQNAVNTYTSSLFNQCAFLCVVPLLTALVNLASIALARVLRNQIRINFQHFKSGSISDSSAGQRTETSEVSTVRHSDTSQKKNWGSRRSSSNQQPSRREIRKFARDEENGILAEQAKKIMVLQKAERDLLLISGFLLFILLGASVLVIWITVSLMYGGAGLGSWPAVEVALFGMEWVYSVTACVTLSFLIYNAYANLTAPLNEPQLDIIEIIGQPINVIASIQGIQEYTSDSLHSTITNQISSYPIQFSNQIEPLEVVVEVEVDVEIDGDDEKRSLESGESLDEKK